MRYGSAARRRPVLLPPSQKTAARQEPTATARQNCLSEVGTQQNAKPRNLRQQRPNPKRLDGRQVAAGAKLWRCRALGQRSALHGSFMRLLRLFAEPGDSQALRRLTLHGAADSLEPVFSSGFSSDQKVAGSSPARCTTAFVEVFEGFPAPLEKLAALCWHFAGTFPGPQDQPRRSLAVRLITRPHPAAPSMR